MSCDVVVVVHVVYRLHQHLAVKRTHFNLNELAKKPCLWMTLPPHLQMQSVRLYHHSDVISLDQLCLVGHRASGVALIIRLFIVVLVVVLLLHRPADAAFFLALRLLRGLLVLFVLYVALLAESPFSSIPHIDVDCRLLAYPLVCQVLATKRRRRPSRACARQGSVLFRCGLVAYVCVFQLHTVPELSRS